MTSILIKSGTVITASETIKADVLIDGEKVIRVEPGITAENAEVIDAAGKYLLPGGVDPHVHIALPMMGTVSSDDFYTGLKAAAFGGTTTVIDFVSQDTDDFHRNIDANHAKAEGMAAVDYAFHTNVSHLTPEVEAQIPRLAEEGITSLKMFTAYNNRMRLYDGEIFRVMRIAAENGLLCMLHAENGDVIDILTAEALAAGKVEPIWHAKTRPAWGAVEAVLRGSALAETAGAALYIVHMNVAGEVDQLAYARQHGIQVMGETCPQYLFFTEEELKRPDGAKWICSPPMRTSADQTRLWGGLMDGTIQTIGTDHCPFFYDGTRPILYEGKPIAIPGKELGVDDFTKIPNGLPGIEDRLPVIWTKGVAAGKLTPNRFVELVSTHPAQIFGLYPQKGTIAVGSDADLVIWDPDKEISYGVKQTHMRTDYNLYEGWTLKGLPEKVFLRGRMIVDGNRWLGSAGQGRFIKRKPFAPIL
jgi:dihydropyrimidinase